MAAGAPPRPQMLGSSSPPGSYNGSGLHRRDSFTPNPRSKEMWTVPQPGGSGFRRATSGAGGQALGGCLRRGGIEKHLDHSHLDVVLALAGIFFVFRQILPGGGCRPPRTPPGSRGGCRGAAAHPRRGTLHKKNRFLLPLLIPGATLFRTFLQLGSRFKRRACRSSPPLQLERLRWCTAVRGPRRGQLVVGNSPATTVFPEILRNLALKVVAPNSEMFTRFLHAFEIICQILQRFAIPGALFQIFNMLKTRLNISMLLQK